MPTQTTNYQLYKPIVNADENSWGTYLNFNFDKLDVELDSLSTRINTNAETASGIDTTAQGIASNVSTQSDQISALQQADTAFDISLSALTTRMTTAESDIDALEAGGGSSSSGATLSTSSVLTVHLAPNCVTHDKLGDDSVRNAAIATAAVDKDSIKNDNVLSRHIAADQIRTSHIVDDAIQSAHIDDNQIQLGHISNNYTLIPKPTSADGDKVLYNDDNLGLIYKRQNKVTRVDKYTDLFSNTSAIEPGDILIVNNGGSAGGSGANDYPAALSGEPTPATLSATSVFLANIEAPDSPADYTTLYTGQNGVTNVDTTDPVRAVFELADGSTYTVNLPQFSIDSENEVSGSATAVNDYLAIFDRSTGTQKKVQLQELGTAMSWGSTIIQNADGTGIMNTLGIILGFSVDVFSGQLVMQSTGGFDSNTANINADGDFILVG